MSGHYPMVEVDWTTSSVPTDLRKAKVLRLSLRPKSGDRCHPKRRGKRRSETSHGHAASGRGVLSGRAARKRDHEIRESRTK